LRAATHRTSYFRHLKAARKWVKAGLNESSIVMMTAAAIGG
jgi:hypothetical protein